MKLIVHRRRIEDWLLEWLENYLVYLQFAWSFENIICRGDQISDELLIYHALLTLESCIDRPWELVVDFTHTTLENRFSVSTKQLCNASQSLEAAWPSGLGTRSEIRRLRVRVPLWPLRWSCSRLSLVQLLGHAPTGLGYLRLWCLVNTFVSLSLGGIPVT